MKTHAGRKLSRPTGPRNSLLRNMATSLLKHETVETTYAKAREVARFTEKVITRAKNRELSAIRRVRADIKDAEVARKLFDVLVPRYQDRKGGCTRVLRLGRRVGDNAEMAVVKLVQ